MCSAPRSVTLKGTFNTGSSPRRRRAFDMRLAPRSSSGMTDMKATSAARYILIVKFPKRTGLNWTTVHNSGEDFTIEQCNDMLAHARRMPGYKDCRFRIVPAPTL